MTSNLVRDLQNALGRKCVLHAPEDLLVYEYDATIERGLPDAVVLPDSAQGVAKAVQIAARHGVPVTARGAGTGLSGGAIPCEGGVVIVTTRMNRILELDPENCLAVVEPGVINLDISRAAASHGLYYAPDPSSQKACTIGGNVAENAGGPHCLRYGTTTNHVLGVEIVTAEGEILWLGGKMGGDTQGYDLTGVVVGSEGTLAIVTKIIVRLLHKPESTITLLAIFDAVTEASRAVSAIIGAGLLPAALEMMDKNTMEAVEAFVHAGYPPDAGAVLLIEVEGLAEDAREQADAVLKICEDLHAREVRVGLTQEDRDRLWAGRKGALGALGRLAPSYYILDGVIPRTRLPAVLDGVYEACERFGFRVANVFHAGDGNLHPNVMFDERVPGATQRVLDLGEDIMRLCVDAGGSITGEHGVGYEKRNYMSWIFSEDDLEVMARLKKAFGAEDGFNPGKIFPTSKGCGEVSSRMRAAIAKVGPDAYV
ncbi:MAG TPA: FAD-linked oxidase C-terminal domain-containing protein [Dehalococcoidia bacterium]|nr:FAD-linked oxidase C-terminal domain-containing protein [Dehalococcoidia bacterium]